MGVRLTIENKHGDIVYYGTKLYGYVNCESSELKSLVYLSKIPGIFRDDIDFEMFPDVCEFKDPIELKNKEMKQFLIFYAEDLKRYTGEKDFLNLPEIKSIFKTKKAHYIVSWGNLLKNKKGQL